MKKFFSIFILFTLAIVAKPILSGMNPVSSDCKFKGKRLAGEFQIVTHGAEFRVEVVNHGPDLRVRKSNFQGSYSCGEWYFSNNPNAIRIEIVNHAPDFRIEYSQSPGRSNSIK